MIQVYNSINYINTIKLWSYSSR